jgi:hypothetical protein
MFLHLETCVLVLFLLTVEDTILTFSKDTYDNIQNYKDNIRSTLSNYGLHLKRFDMLNDVETKLYQEQYFQINYNEKNDRQNYEMTTIKKSNVLFSLLSFYVAEPQRIVQNHYRKYFEYLENIINNQLTNTSSWKDEYYNRRCVFFCY